MTIFKLVEFGQILLLSREYRLRRGFQAHQRRNNAQGRLNSIYQKFSALNIIPWSNCLKQTLMWNIVCQKRLKNWQFSNFLTLAKFCFFGASMLLRIARKFWRFSAAWKFQNPDFSGEFVHQFKRASKFANVRRWTNMWPRTTF